MKLAIDRPIRRWTVSSLLVHVDEDVLWQEDYFRHAVVIGYLAFQACNLVVEKVVRDVRMAFGV